MTIVEGLVGRQGELASLDRFLGRAGEIPSALLLEGEAGIGKTSLWNEGVERGRARGFRVLSTRPGGTEVQLAFAGVADLLGGVAAETLPGLPLPQRRALEVALLLEEPDGSPPDDRAVAAAFLGSVRLLAASEPVLIAVDDVQWLDSASMRVLEFACRRLDAEAVALLATVRIAPDEAEPVELSRAFGDRVEHLVVGPLTLAAVYQLVRAHLDLSLSRPALLRIHEASGGNPFFALELSRALQRAKAQPVPGEPLPVPQNLRALVRSRLALLPDSVAATTLFAAALSQPTVTVVELAAGSPERVRRDLEAAERAGVIELQGEQIRFAHPLLASIHFASESPAARRAVHRRLAAVVVDPEERARHLALATDGADAEVAAALAEAAEHARRRGAIAAGAELAEQAFRITPASLTAEARERLLISAEQHYAAGNTPRAVELLEEALAEAPPGPSRAELLWSLGKIMFEGQDTRVGLDFFRRALAETRDDDLLRARILGSLTFPAGKQEGFQVAQGYAREAAALAERLGDTPTLARALAELGDLKFICGEGVATNLFEQAVALEDELDGLELDYGPTARYAFTLTDAGHFDRARPLLERLCARGRASGDAAVNLPLFLLANVEFELGNWERAEELARESYDVAIQTGREAAEPKGLFTMARIDAGRGNVDAARERAEQALVLTDGRGWSSGGPRSVLGFLELSLENYQAAYEALIPAVERYRSLGAPLIGQTFDAVEALAGMGRVEEGRELLSRVDEAPGMMRLAWAKAAADRARGLLAAADDDLEAASVALEVSVDAGEGADGSLELGRSLLALGSVQRRARKKQEARQTLERALEIFDRLGARLWAERARRELRRIGGRSTPRATLSATENEIVELVVAGRSNKEVAQALHLSPKTVEWNLSKIYRRLGVRSRTELAAGRRKA